MMNRKYLTPLAVAIISFSTSACVKRMANQGVSPNGGGSVVASVDKVIDPDVQKVEGIEYWLKCKTGVAITGKVITKDDQNFIEFDGKHVRDGDECYMQVKTAPENIDNDKISWFGEYKDGSKAVGIYYDSEYAKVDKRKLDIVLNKLYAIEIAKSFSAKFAAKIEREEALADSASYLINLTCKVGDEAKVYASDKVKIKDAAEKTLDLTVTDLPVDELKDKSCDELSVIDQKADGNSLTYTSKLEDVSFADVKTGDELEFPKQDGLTEYVLKIVDTSAITPTITAGECFKFVTGETPEDRKCLDVRSVDLPYTNNLLVAMVKGRTEDGKGTPREYVMGIGEAGFSHLTADKLTVDAINTALAGDEESQKAYNWFSKNSQALKDAEEGKFFTDLMLSGEAYAADAVERSSLAGVKILHIEVVYAFGMKATDEAKLIASELPVYWTAEVKLTKDAESKSFVIGGKDGFLKSDAHPVAATDDAAAKMFDLATYLNDSSAWTSLAEKGNELVAEECGLESLAAINGTLSSAKPSELEVLPEALSQCKLKDDALADLEADAWTVESKFSILSWSKL